MVFLGGTEGKLYKYSIGEQKIICEYDIKNTVVDTLILSQDKKTLFGGGYGFFEIDVMTKQTINHFETVEKIRCMILTPDNRYLITACDKKITKFCTKTREKLHTLHSSTDDCTGVRSLTCTHDNNYLFIGYQHGYIAIFNLLTNETEKTTRCLSAEINAVVITKSDSDIYICDWTGYLRKMKWKRNCFSKDFYEFTEKPQKVGSDFTYHICLTKNEDNLLIGSRERVRIYDLQKKALTIWVKLQSNVHGLILMRCQTKVFITEENGDFTIFDLEKLDLERFKGPSVYSIASI